MLTKCKKKEKSINKPIQLITIFYNKKLLHDLKLKYFEPFLRDIFKFLINLWKNNYTKFCVSIDINIDHDISMY